MRVAHVPSRNFLCWQICASCVPAAVPSVDDDIRNSWFRALAGSFMNETPSADQRAVGIPGHPCSVRIFQPWRQKASCGLNPTYEKSSKKTADFADAVRAE